MPGGEISLRGVSVMDFQSESGTFKLTAVVIEQYITLPVPVRIPVFTLSVDRAFLLFLFLPPRSLQGILLIVLAVDRPRPLQFLAATYDAAEVYLR